MNGPSQGSRRTFVLIPGAGGTAWYWHRIVPLLREAGHAAIAVDLPGDDPAAGLPEYADLVTSAIGNRGDVVLVAQSLGGFTAPLVAAKVPVAALVFVNAMIPRPGETTSRRRSPRRASRTSGPRPTRRSSRAATSAPGRPSRSGRWPGPMTGSSRSASSRR
jgi:pimeloyl-ACP methyl ester carboxylesterase